MTYQHQQDHQPDPENFTSSSTSDADSKGLAPHGSLESTYANDPFTEPGSTRSNQPQPRLTTSATLEVLLKDWKTPWPLSFDVEEGADSLLFEKMLDAPRWMHLRFSEDTAFVLMTTEDILISFGIRLFRSSLTRQDTHSCAPIKMHHETNPRSSHTFKVSGRVHPPGPACQPGMTDEMRRLIARKWPKTTHSSSNSLQPACCIPGIQHFSWTHDDQDSPQVYVSFESSDAETCVGEDPTTKWFFEDDNVKQDGSLGLYGSFW